MSEQAPGTTIVAADSVMWVGNVRSLPFEKQVRAAALAGFGGISITPLGWHQAIAQGMSTAEMRAICADHGITRIHLDPLARWTERWRAENLDPAVFPPSFFAFDSDDFLRIAEGLGATSLTAIATFPAGSVRIERMTEDFAAVCDRARDIGVHCSLEFIPLEWAVPDLETAWAIVQGADRNNSGIVVDTWCFHRSGSSLELLGQVPGERIDFVQVTDGLLDVPEGRSWVDDNLQNRLPPGLGEFPLSDILQTLAASGHLGSVGPEMFAWQFDTMTAEEIADVCRSSLAAAADAAGVAHDLGAATPGWAEVFTSRRASSTPTDAAPARSHI